MILKSLKQKSRDFAFESFGNLESESPARIVFSRFPLPDESFPVGSQKQVLDSSVLRTLDDSPGSKEKLVDHIIGNMIENITANRIDHRRFFSECVERIEDLGYDGNEIKTVDDFFRFLPGEASFAIAQEAYVYAKEADVFTAEDKKKSDSGSSCG